MPGDNVGSKRLESDDQDVPAELSKREAQDRASAEKGGGSRSPVDSMHVDAPKQQDNKRGHARSDALDK